MTPAAIRHQLRHARMATEFLFNPDARLGTGQLLDVDEGLGSVRSEIGLHRSSISMIDRAFCSDKLNQLHEPSSAP